MARKGKKAVEAAKDIADRVPAPSPNPMTNLILADIALRTGGALLRRGVEKGLVGSKLGAKKAGRVIKGRTMMQTLVGTAIARIATRSVPGAIIVGGGMLAKTLYDRKREKEAKSDGSKALEKQVERGKKG
ncbi:hypothetical protein Saro_1004 [Novosphingobium aromaticivorans DSM 12444]|uniref:Uncharacterized protein n=1 Tax=Novosphingobium aromaticivorans (strain ATCC 700278 / DSM 12444 / CCUG 56034 / CIP 105152 / NBRC 16084 / F199) TaxID=279238 RepID=Q2G9M4_NOVAD|nr:hypothetical protein [Novosphingobium aromaticivorans]ABD25449.1 hypothetical protein Saro_1004 [Novosphingobium aromaticivorans DSM 12444]SCX93956.1 hypothetical protein SAMN05660666_00334 [Novosphingobium aromaticivorans]